MLIEKLEFAVYLMFIGMGVVFLSLFILMCFIKLIGIIEKGMIRLKKKPGSLEAPPVGEEVVATSGISDEDAAVLAAAVHSVLDTPVEIRQVRVIRGDGGEAWSQQGRIDIMRSHNIKTPQK